MAAIQFTDRRTATRLSVESLALARAASAATSAPSMVTGRPWRWRIDGTILSLYADPADIDDDRALIVNCGIVLHHARTALAADGVAADVRYVPDPTDPSLLATVRHAGPARASAGEVRLYRAIAARRSDTRPLATTAPVPDGALDRILATAQRPDVDLRTHGDLLSIHLADDRPENLLKAGEVTSAILLAANAEGLATELGRGRDGAVTTIRIGLPVSGLRTR